MVAVELTLPMTVDGANDMDESAGGLTVRVVVRVTPEPFAVIVPTVVLATGDVVITKLTDEAPPFTCTEAGTCTAELLLVRAMSTPLGGAVPVSAR